MTRHKQSEDTWQRILDSAEELFALAGYDGASTRDIAGAAGISINTLHYHCGGKKNLYDKVLERAVVSVTNLVNAHVEGMIRGDLNDPEMLEESITRLIDELFDMLHSHPHYARLFFRQLLVTDLDLRNVEDDKLVPTVRGWSEQIESRVGKERLGTMNLFLFFLSASLMYWGLFVQPKFIARYFRIEPDSDEFLTIVKAHAREMTLRMVQEGRSRLP
jgi:AcrR family transcriptional regulator